MEYRLLGPLEVLAEERLVPVGGGRRLSLLAYLLIHANEVVSAERLVDELWGESPPSTAAKSLQVKVSQLRRSLGAGHAPLLTRGSGYVLQVAPDELDSRRFESGLEDGRRRLAVGDAAGAARCLDDALDLWRGPALSGLEYEPFAQQEIARLEELRVVALEERSRARLALGEHARAVPELEALVRAYPLRERLRAQLMLALYRSGRQADALVVYRDARHRLSEELGLEPGEELRRLELAVLQQAPELDLSAHPPTAAGSPHTPNRSLLVVPRGVDGTGPLLALAKPLAGSSPPREIVIAAVVEAAQLRAATTALAGHRNDLLSQGEAARTAAFSSPAPGEDLVRLASEENAELILMDAGTDPLAGAVAVVLERAPCDVALLVEGSGSLRDGPVVVPFGAGWHDWAALEFGACIARAAGFPLRLIGAASDSRDARDASRVLADASLIVQRRMGVLAEPLLGRPGRQGVMALADGAGLLVVGLSERWGQEGLGRIRNALVAGPPAPTVLVRRGAREGLAPTAKRTPFGWSVTANVARPAPG